LRSRKLEWKLKPPVEAILRNKKERPLSPYRYFGNYDVVQTKGERVKQKYGEKAHALHEIERGESQFASRDKKREKSIGTRGEGGKG